MLGDTKTPQVPAGDTFWLAWINFLGLVTHIIIRDEKNQRLLHMLPSYLHNNVFSAPNWTFVHGFCVLVPNYVANHVVFWSNFCRESRCFGDTFRPLKKLLVTQKVFFAGLLIPT